MNNGKNYRYEIETFAENRTNGNDKIKLTIKLTEIYIEIQERIKYHKNIGTTILVFIVFDYALGRIDFMAAITKKDYQIALEEQKTEVRNLVIAGLEQIKEGKTKDFNSVCDRLEKKYKDEAL